MWGLQPTAGDTWPQRPSSYQAKVLAHLPVEDSGAGSCQIGVKWLTKLSLFEDSAAAVFTRLHAANRSQTVLLVIAKSDVKVGQLQYNIMMTVELKVCESAELIAVIDLQNQISNAKRHYNPNNGIQLSL